jgi:predicted transcriptional regulator
MSIISREVPDEVLEMAISRSLVYLAIKTSCGPLRTMEITEELSMSKRAVSDSIYELRNEGYVESEYSMGDARGKAHSTTGKGVDSGIYQMWTDSVVQGYYKGDKDK